MKLKAVVIGAGPIGGAHVNALKKLPGVEITHLVDLNAALLESRCKEFGVRGLGAIEEIPAETDFVTVATPPASHAGLVRQLLQRDFHVFCEKPLTLKLPEANELRDLAAARKRHLGVGFKMRYEPWFQKAKELLPRLGRLRQVVTTKQQAYAPGVGKAWIETTGAMQELSSHDFDLIHWLAGTRPEKMLSAHLSKELGWPAEDGFNLVVRYEGGMVGSLNGLYSKSITWTGRDNYYRFAGDNGYLAIDRFDRVVLHLDRVETFTFDGCPNTFEKELGDFAGAVMGKPARYPDAQAGIDSLWVVEAARKAAGA